MARLGDLSALKKLQKENKKKLVEELCELWSSKNALVKGKCIKNDRGLLIVNLTDLSGKKIVYPNGKKITIKPPGTLLLKPGRAYKFKFKLAADHLREKFKNEHFIEIDSNYDLQEVKIVDASSNLVKEIYNEYVTAGGMLMMSLRGAIKRIAYDINRKPETFIFELLQNADDYPKSTNKKVKVIFKVIDDYLVFKHNGLPFKESNVRALCSVDAGDKYDDFEKIGYKGVGFKSIFKHSNYVALVSGKFSFRFDEEYHLNQDRETFWQLIPVWTKKNEYPQSIKDELNSLWDVKIAIRPEEGMERLISYEETFQKVFKDERVLLFLRNVNELNFKGSKTSFKKSINENDWLLSELEPIKVPRDIRDGLNAKIGRDDRIPEKYKNLDITKLTFATRLSAGKILKTDNTKVYAYLPTELNFGFPFILNGDFIPDGGRSYLHADIAWNQFLFKQCGIQLLLWIKRHWSKNQDIGIFNMIPSDDELISEKPDDEKEILLSHFLNGVKMALEEVNFIPNSRLDLLLATEIIIDDTGVFKNDCLGASLFDQIVPSKKTLPLEAISSAIGVKYLNIERFNNEALVNVFLNLEIYPILTEAVNALDPDKYRRFIEVINKLLAEQNESNTWINRVPIFKLSNQVLSLDDLLSKNNILVRNRLLDKSVELIEKCGFQSTTINFDDFPNIYAILKDNLSYLRENTELFKIINNVGEFKSVTGQEKNKLVAFFKSLNDVGPARYAQELNLFNSQDANRDLQPLKKLISLECENLPKWLSFFQINEEEHNALSDEFRRELLSKDELLKHLFCDIDLFEEIVKKINLENVTEFYEYLIELKDSTDDSNLDYSSIPLVYLSKTEEFTLAKNVFWPDSLTKLPEVKFKNVKIVIENLTGLVLPHFSALQLKSAFSLGASNHIFIDEINKPNSFDLEVINDFLDWAETEIDEHFLSKISIERVDNVYQLSKASEKKYYYTNSEKLKQFIEDNDTQSLLTCLPKELNSNDRNKIGLLVEDQLYLYLIEHKIGGNDLARYLSNNLNNEVKVAFIDSIDSVEFTTDSAFSESDETYHIIRMVSSTLSNDKDRLKNLRKKLIVDGHTLDSRAISSDIFFKGLEGQINLTAVVKLEEVLPHYLERSFSVDQLKNCFPELTTSFIFKQEYRSVKRIYKELKELNIPFYSPEQTLFLSIYNYYYEIDNPFHETQILFLEESLESEKQSSLSKYLKLLYKQWTINVQIFGPSKLGNFDFSKINLDPDFALDGEKPQQWLIDWIERNDKEKRIHFLAQLGVKNEESTINQLRKALNENTSIAEVGLNGIQSKFLFSNTFFWLQMKQNEGAVLSRDQLKPLYDKAIALGFELKNIPLPIRTNIEKQDYKLTSITDETPLFLLDESWKEQPALMMNHINSFNGKLLDDLIENEHLSELDIKSGEISTNINQEELNERINFEEPYFTAWEKNAELKVTVYNGQSIPYQINFGSINLGDVNHKVIDKLESGEIIICKHQVDSFPDCAKGFIDEALYNSLKVFKAEYLKKQKENKFSDSEFLELKKLFGQQRAEEFRKDDNLAACVAALIWYDKNGYDVKQAEENLKESHTFSQLSPVNIGESAKTIMCRSAVAGILFLQKNAWDRLNNKDIELFVRLGKGENASHQFQNQDEILEISDTRFQVFRVETPSNAATTNKIISGNFEENENYWMLFKMKSTDQYNSIFDIIRRRENSITAPETDNSEIKGYE